MLPFYDEALKQILRIKKVQGEPVRPGYSGNLEAFQEEFHQYFGVALDKDFIVFCKTVNGLAYCGTLLYGIGGGSPYDLVENNIEWKKNTRLDQYILYGDNGMDLIANDPETESFHLLEKPTFEEVADYASFDEAVSVMLNQLID